MRLALSVNRILFVAALALYSVIGSPTPDAFGLAEIAILICLALSFCISFSKQALSGFVLLGYGFSVPVLFALINGYPVVEIIRDIVPFVFLLLPILYFYRQEQDKHFLLFSIIGIGLSFSIRSLSSFGVSIWYPDEWLGSPPDLLYLANSPEVLFSAVALIYLACFGRSYNLGIRILFLILSALPLLAMMTLMQRASLFYIVALIVSGLIILIWQKPKMAAGFIVVIAGFVFMANSFLAEIYGQMTFKTQMVGLNSRGAEWIAVFREVSQSPARFLFGLGWGANFEDPAVGGLRVSFTHSLISSMLLKTGVTGVALFFVYGVGLLRQAWRNLMQYPLYLCALAGPLLIGLSLYASYKSLGYGLLLLLLSSLANGKRLEQQSQTVP